MNEQQRQECIDSALTDVINQLHHVKGDDRMNLLLEWVEFLTYEPGEIEVQWMEYQKCPEGLT